MGYKIALIDDDRNIITSVSMTLEAEGYDVVSYNDGVDGYDGMTASPPDLAVMDIKMPRMDGMALLEKLRAQSVDLPIILLTSKDDEVDEILGLRMGADDYITKPFSQRLLIERIRSLLRRQEVMANSAAGKHKEIIKEIGCLALDDARHLCRWKRQPLNLTVTEYLLIKALAERPGHVKNRDQLIDAAYGENIYVDDRTIDSHIKRVRQKFKKLDPEFDQIETLYGVGYRYKES